jgi:hypothetical protein
MKGTLVGKLGRHTHPTRTKVEGIECHPHCWNKWYFSGSTPLTMNTKPITVDTKAMVPIMMWRSSHQPFKRLPTCQGGWSMKPSLAGSTAVAKLVYKCRSSCCTEPESNKMGRPRRIHTCSVHGAQWYCHCV